MAEDKDTTDIQVAGGLTVAGLLSDEGLQALQGVLQGASDPAAAVANAVFMALSKVREQLDERGVAINDKLWIANGGVLDRVIFEVCSVLRAVFGFEQAGSEQFVSALKEEVLALMAQDQEGGNPAAVQPQPAPQQMQQPPMQGGGLMGMG